MSATRLGSEASSRPDRNTALHLGARYQRLRDLRHFSWVGDPQWFAAPKRLRTMTLFDVT